MKKIYFKITSLLLILILAFSIITGCGQQNTVKPDEGKQGNEQGSGTDKDPKPTEVSSKPAELTILLRERWAGISYDNFVNNYVQEQTNTKWNLIIVPASDMMSKLNLAFSTNDVPDIMNLPADDNYVYKLAMDGALLPINKYIDKAPNLLKNHQEIWNLMKFDDGNIYQINGNINNSSLGVDFVPTYRKDWLDKLGLKVPETIEEYFEVADAVSNKDPDGNGKKDTFAFGGCGFGDTRYYEHVFSAFGVLPFRWIIEDGKLINCAVHPNMREALRAMNKLYEMGAIDPEFITDDENRTNNKFKEGLYGACCMFIWAYDTRNKANYYEPFKEKNPDGELIEGPILKGPGYREDIGMSALSLRGWLRTGVSAKTKEIDAVFRLLDWLNTEENIMFMNFGVENEHYTVNDEGIVDYLITDDQIKELGLTQTYISFTWRQDGYSKELHRIREYARTLSTPDPTDGLVIDPKIADYFTDFRDFAATMTMQIIVGEVPVDEGFDAILDEWKKRGGEELTEAYNKAYKARHGNQ